MLHFTFIILKHSIVIIAIFTIWLLDLAAIAEKCTIEIVIIT